MTLADKLNIAALSLGLLGISFCYTPKPSFRIINEDPYDYCQITKTSNPIDQYLSGEKVPSATVYEKKKENVVKPIRLVEGKISKKEDYYHLMLVPVDYEDPRKDLDSIIQHLEAVFKDVRITFSYLGESVPINIKHIKHYVFLEDETEAKNLFEMIEEKYGVNRIAFIVNSSQQLGGSKGEYIIFSGSDKETTPFVAIHEVGHQLGLGDGYKRYYKEENINNSEMYTEWRKLPELIRQAYYKIKPPIYETGNFCNGEPVFSFYNPDRDVMDRFFPRKELEILRESETALFNEMQIEIMNMTIKDRLG